MSDQGEFNTLAHGIDSVRTDTDPVPKVPFEGTRLSATPSAQTLCAMLAFAATQRNDGVVSFAVNAAGVRGFFQGPDG